MSYVPPHLRNKANGVGSDAADAKSAAPPSGGARFGDYGRFNPRDAGRGGDQPRPSTFPRGGSSGWSGSRGPPRDEDFRSASTSAPVPVWPKWVPSERAQKLSAEQISDIRQRLNLTIESDEGQEEAPAAIESFDDMNLCDSILQDIRKRDYSSPTPIQSQGIPVALSGRDLLGCAETGSGKTASFAIPAIHHCLQQAKHRPGDGPMALVMAPTRELAQQIEKELQLFSRSSNVRTCIVVGGTNMHDQKRELRRGVEVVVATPGRLLDHLQQQNTALNRVSFVVLDEADRMLDMGFEPQIKEIMGGLPERCQTLLFSATMPQEIESLARSYMRSPVRVKVGQVSAPTANVSQHLEKVQESAKLQSVCELLLREQSDAETTASKLPMTIVFVERKSRCSEVADAICQVGIEARAIHGGLSQWEREAALKAFTSGTCVVLVATDVASRGLDVKGIKHVINMDLPHTFEDYVHRIGRTGRAGCTGRATSFYTDREAFLVSQIKNALQELESGNSQAFATGKAARKKEKELAIQFKDNMRLGKQGVISQPTGATVQLHEKLKFMANATPSAGAADDAWDD